MRDSERVLAAIRRIAREELEWEGEVHPGMDLVEDLGLDSLRLLTLAVEIENHFEICLEEADEAAIRTVSDLVDVVDKKLTDRGK